MIIKTDGLRRRQAALVFICCLAMQACASPIPNDAQPTSESFYQRLARSVVRLEIVLDQATDERKSIGTGFLVLHKGALYLVTAGHVQASGAPLRARIPALRQDTQKRDVIELRIPHEAWVAHPTKATELDHDGKPESTPLTVRPVDVAVAALPWPPAHQLAPIRTFSDTDPEPPEPVLVFGYPRNLGFDLAEPRPLGRAGIVAMTAKEPYIWYRSNNNHLNGSYADSRVRALDIRMFAGNSGSPVLRATGVDQELVLLGLITGGDEPLDIAVSEPVSRIRETLEFAHTLVTAAKAEWIFQKAKSN